MDLQSVGKLVVVAGIALALMGGLLWLGGRLGLGSLPGTLHFSGQGWSCFVPIGVSILLSLLLTLLLTFLARYSGK